MGHEVVASHHGDLEVEARLFDDLLHGLRARQRIDASRVTHDANACEGGKVEQVSI